MKLKPKNQNEKNQKIQNLKFQNLTKIYPQGKFFSYPYYEPSITISNLSPITINDHNLTIGKGAFSEVFISKHIKTNETYAIKKMEKNFLLKTINSLQVIYNEIEIQSRIIHPNIIRLYNTYENNKEIYLIMEYIKGGNLYSLIKRKNGLNEKESFKYFYQILKAVYFLHKNNIIHRDIKPENILIDDYGNCKLCDFGWAVLTNENQLRSTFCGTVEYMAPEIINNEKYDKSIDIWSLGVLLFELIHGYSPFSINLNINKCFSMNDLIDNIKNENFEIRRNISNQCKDIIEKMLEKDCKKRICVDDIFKHDFIVFNNGGLKDVDVGFSQDGTFEFSSIREEEKFQIPYTSPIVNTFKNQIEKENEKEIKNEGNNIIDNKINNNNNFKKNKINNHENNFKEKNINNNENNVNDNKNKNNNKNNNNIKNTRNVTIHFKSNSENIKNEKKGEILKCFSRKKIRDFTRNFIDNEIEQLEKNNKEEKIIKGYKNIPHSSTILNNSYFKDMNNKSTFQRTNTKVVLKFIMKRPISRENSSLSLNSKKENINSENNNYNNNNNINNNINNNNNNNFHHQKNKSVNILNTDNKKQNKRSKIILIPNNNNKILPHSIFGKTNTRNHNNKDEDQINTVSSSLQGTMTHEKNINENTSGNIIRVYK